jgi:hypothetical protein
MEIASFVAGPLVLESLLEASSVAWYGGKIKAFALPAQIPFVTWLAV